MVVASGRVFFRATILLICLSAFFKPALGTTVIIPTDEDMVIGARAIVKGKVLSVGSGFDEQHNAIFTYITLRVNQVVKGNITSRKIVIKEQGGELGDISSVIFGTPQFSKGEKVLLYLDTWPDGSFRVHQWFLGKYSIVDDASSGQSFVVRDAPDSRVRVLQAQSEANRSRATDRMEIDAYIEMIRQLIASTAERAQVHEQTFYRGVPVLARPPEFDSKLKDGGIQPQFTFLNPSNPSRWFEPDSGQPVVFKINAEGAPMPDIVNDMVAAMGAWSSVSSSSMRVVNGGSTSGCGLLSSDGENTIFFNNCDHYSAFGPTGQGCSGVLAAAGIIRTNSQTKVVNNTTFLKALESNMSFNPAAGCFFTNHCNIQEVATHEMGHTLGLGHSADTSATMYAFAHADGRCASLQTDDIDGISFIYPATTSGPGPLAIVTSTLTGATTGTPYSQTLVATGGAGAYTWSLQAGLGSLPPGLSLSASGIISGTPSTTGNFSFTVRVSDTAGASAQKALSIIVGSGAAPFDSQFVSQSVPETLQPGQSFNVNMKWSNTGTAIWSDAIAIRLGSQNPPNNTTWGGNTVILRNVSISAGQLLDVTFTAFAPNTPGTYNFQWQLVQNNIFFGQMSQNVSIVVASQSTPPSITSPSSLSAVKGVAFSQQLTGAGGKTPYTWSIVAGSLPAGFTLSSTTGIINGNATATGSFGFTAQLTDSNSQTAQKAITLTVAAPALSIDNLTPPQAGLGSPFSFQLKATGGTAPYIWSIVAGSLPAGLTLNSTSGLISGAPSSQGTFNFTAQARDALSQTDQKAFSISVAALPLQITSSALSPAVIGLSFSQQLAATGGTAPYTWSITAGALPPGMTIASGTGTISGTPTQNGVFAFTVTARDKVAATASKAMEMRVVAPEEMPRITRLKYKKGDEKLIVYGDNMDRKATLLIDGSPVSAKFKSGKAVASHLILPKGAHIVRVVNPSGIASEAAGLTID